jgi:hypothetical protein
MTLLWEAIEMKRVVMKKQWHSCLEVQAECPKEEVHYPEHLTTL